MSDRFPDEVLLLILDQLTAARMDDLPSQQLLHRMGRYKDLLPVCLASRRMRRLAQPLLWQHVANVRPGHLEQIRRSSVASTLGVRMTIYTAMACPSFPLEEAVDVAGLLPNIRAMHLHSLITDGPWLTNLQSHTHLRFLRLAFVDINFAGRPVPVLPQLERLELEYIDMTLPEAQRWLDPSRLPRLRVLYAEGPLRDPHSGESLLWDKALLPGILNLLDYVLYAHEALDSDGELANGTGPPVLTLDPLNFAILPRHSIQNEWCKDTHADDEAKLCQLVRQMSPTTAANGPRAVLILPDRAAIRREYKLVRWDAFDVKELESACRECGVLLLRHARLLDRFRVPKVPGEFVRYARDLREARERGAA